MNATSMRRGTTILRDQEGIEWVTAALCFALVVYLGLKGGGYDPLVHDPVGIAAWWVVLVGVAIGALPRERPARVAWLALGLLAAFALWTALSLAWTDSAWRTWADVARIAGYAGIFALAVLSRADRKTELLLGAVAAAIVTVTAVALLSRLHPSWFPEAGQTAAFIADSRERLSYPIDYWNGLGALIAIGIPLVLHFAAGARSLVLRSLAAAALPAMTLTVFYTLSRGSIAAAGIAVAVFIAISSDRLPRLVTLLLTGAGGAVLVAVADGKDALQHGLANDAAVSQGTSMIWVVLAVCIVVGLLQTGLSLALTEARRPRWTRVGRSHAIAATAAAATVALVVAVAIGAPGRASDGWSEFKEGGGPGSGTERLNSVAGQSRYQFWRAALHENESKPLTGTGSGTFELWWARNATTDESVRDTHSLYMQTLGELGVVGFVLLIAFLMTVFFAGGRAAIRVGAARRPTVAAALAAATAFCFTAAVDWMWQIPALAVVLLLVASTLVAARPASEAVGDRRVATPGLRAAGRVGFATVALVSIVAIAIPLAATRLLRESEADARNGDLSGALGAARTAQNVLPGSAAPRLQEALVLEAQGSLHPAVEAARAATEREETNWRNWLVLSRIEAENGEATAAVRDYRRARSLNPRSSIFDR